MFISRLKTIVVVMFLLATLQSLHAQSNLAEDLKLDNSLQDAVIIALRSALGARQQLGVVRRGSFLVEVGFYIETYRDMRNTNTLANIQNRYVAARAELLEPRLPATVEELVSVLESASKAGN